MALAVPVAYAQPKPPDAGNILEQTRDPIRLPPRTDSDVRPRPPEPRPALPPQPSLKVKVEKFVFSGNTIYGDAELQEIVKEFIGKELNFEGLNEAATKVRAYHRERGYFLAQAYLPAQKIVNGAVEIAIIEGRVGRLELDRRPASRLSERLLVGIIDAHLGEGDIITETGLERPLLLINDLPTAVVVSDIRPSQTVGAADLRIAVDQGIGWFNGSVDFDNFGNRFTGEHRFGATLNINNPTGWGDQVSLRAFRTQAEMWYVRGSYLVPVTYSGTRLGVSYSKFDYAIGKDFANLRANGEGEVISVYGFHPLVRTRNTNFIVQMAYEDKELIDRIDLTGSITLRNIQTLRLGFVGDFRDGFLGGGLNSYSGSLTGGELDIGPAGPLALDQAAAGRKTLGSFSKWNFDVRRQQRIRDNISLLIAGTAQLASKNLTSAEKFSLGGPEAVRAYPVGEATGDSGYLLQLEGRYITPFKAFGGDVTFLGFVDSGYVKVNQNPLPTDNENHRNIAGYGLGFSLGRDGDFLVRASAAWKLSSDAPQADSKKVTPRIWFQGVKWF